jgi:hypothetical protein
LPGYPASHGCIRMPAEFATRLFALTRLGARVIVARTEVSLVEIAHPLLFARKERAPDAQPAAELPADAAKSGGVKIAEASDRTTASDASNAKDISDANEIAASDVAANAPELDPNSRAVEDEINRAAAITGELRLAIDAFKPPATPEPAVASPQSETQDAPKSTAGEAVPPTPPETAKPPEPPRRTGPVAVFVSRKDRKVYVRQGFEPLFDAEVTIRDADQSFGTHVFTAMEFQDDGASLRWTAVSMPGEPDFKRAPLPKGKRIADVLTERAGNKAKPAPQLPPPESAAGVGARNARAAVGARPHRAAAGSGRAHL